MIEKRSSSVIQEFTALRKLSSFSGGRLLILYKRKLPRYRHDRHIHNSFYRSRKHYPHSQADRMKLPLPSMTGKTSPWTAIIDSELPVSPFLASESIPRAPDVACEPISERIPSKAKWTINTRHEASQLRPVLPPCFTDNISGCSLSVAHACQGKRR
jgi:hypothetical protein